MTILARGAEALLYHNPDGTLVKERVRKNYRIAALDEKLRQFRTRREAKILKKLADIGIPAPILQSVNDKNMTITMSFITGKLVKDVLATNPESYGLDMGRKIGRMHANDIIHSDLTTSNMIVDGEIKLIDFGLSYISPQTEDKAVDLHVLKQALQSKHHEISESCFNAVVQGYQQTNPEALAVLSRLEKVELRGRNKKK